MNRISQDNYERPEFTEQDYISSNKPLLKEKLKDYIQVEYNQSYLILEPLLFLEVLSIQNLQYQVLKN